MIAPSLRITRCAVTSALWARAGSSPAAGSVVGARGHRGYAAQLQRVASSGRVTEQFVLAGPGTAEPRAALPRPTASAHGTHQHLTVDHCCAKLCGDFLTGAPKSGCRQGKDTGHAEHGNSRLQSWRSKQRRDSRALLASNARPGAAPRSPTRQPDPRPRLTADGFHLPLSSSQDSVSLTRDQD